MTEITTRSAMARGGSTGIAAMMLFLVTGCASPHAPNLNEPPAWHAAEGDKARRHMQLMADQLMQLTILTMNDSPVGDMRTRDEKQLQVLGWLNQIEQEARKVGASFMGEFLEDVSLARQFSRQEPPNFVPANRLVKSCLSCHESLQPDGL